MVSRKTFGKFEDALYLFQKSLGEEICQTTIDVAPFQQQNVKRYLKKHTNCVPKQVDFANYKILASKALYFRVNENFNRKNLEKVIAFINNYK